MNKFLIVIFLVSIFSVSLPINSNATLIGSPYGSESSFISSVSPTNVESFENISLNGVNIDGMILSDFTLGEPSSNAYPGRVISYSTSLDGDQVVHALFSEEDYFSIQFDAPIDAFGFSFELPAAIGDFIPPSNNYQFGLDVESQGVTLTSSGSYFYGFETDTPFTSLRVTQISSGNFEPFWDEFRYRTAAAPSAPSAPVPEPVTMLLFGTGLVGLVGSSLRKKK